MLRRRHHPQEETARKAEEGQEAPENDRQRGNPAGSLHGGFAIGRGMKSSIYGQPETSGIQFAKRYDY